MSDYTAASFDALKGEVLGVIAPLKELAELAGKKESPSDKGKDKQHNPLTAARKVQGVMGSATAALGLPLQLMNTGFALATEKIAAVFPALPASFLGCLYIGPPHGHMHPPSLIPPAPAPIPLPSMGTVLLGTCIKVLIHNMPAARAGDIGLAPTCCGVAPMFEIKTGSSKVFIGGSRAARIGDICVECVPSGGGSMGKMAMAMTALSLAADVGEGLDAMADHDPDLAAAKAVAAAMTVATTAAELATNAIKQAIGKDPGVAATPGALLLGHPLVLIGGFPMVNFPDPVQFLMKKLRAKLRKKKSRKESEDDEHAGCADCKKGAGS